MRLPGFAAEDSLSSTRAGYKVVTTHASPVGDGTVLPQFFHCWGDYCCNEFGYCIYKGHLLM